MTNELDVDQLEEALAAVPEGTENLNEDKLAELRQEMNQRYSGFQSLLDKKMAEIVDTISELKTARMSPEEREELEEVETKRELAKLKRENDILKMRTKYPEAVDTLMQVLDQQSLEKQLEILTALSKGKNSGPTPSEEPDVSPAPVDANNPPRKPEASLASLVKGGQMTKEQAAKILGASNEKGFLARLRG